MLSFFTQKKSTAFDTCHELSHFQQLLTKLRNKHTTFKQAAEKYGADSLEYRKQIIFDKLLTEYDSAIAEFNAKSATLSPDERKQAIIQLVKKLANETNVTLYKFDLTLRTLRNSRRSMVNTLVHYGTYGAAVTTIKLLAFSTMGAIGLIFFAAPMISRATRENSGLTNKLPESFYLLKQTNQVLTCIGENMGLEKNWNKLPTLEIEATPPEYCCLITQNVMRDPVLCTLDMRTYEREAITHWLELKHKSPYPPFNPVPEGCDISDLLKPNEALKSLIDTFRASHPQLQDADYPIEHEAFIPRI